MKCKYCKKDGHLIDFCPDIVCKKCKQYGHAHWKCKAVKSAHASKKILKKIIPSVPKKENIVKVNTNPYAILSDGMEEEITNIRQILKYKEDLWDQL